MKDKELIQSIRSMQSDGKQYFMKRSIRIKFKKSGESLNHDSLQKFSTLSKISILGITEEDIFKYRSNHFESF